MAAWSLPSGVQRGRSPPGMDVGRKAAKAQGESERDCAAKPQGWPLAEGEEKRP